jgi:hypothetical protein
MCRSAHYWPAVVLIAVVVNGVMTLLTSSGLSPQ